MCIHSRYHNLIYILENYHNILILGLQQLSHVLSVLVIIPITIAAVIEIHDDRKLSLEKVDLSLWCVIVHQAER